QQRLRQCLVVITIGEQTELSSQASLVDSVEDLRKRTKQLLRLPDRLVLILGQQSQQAFRKASQIPQDDPRLVRVGREPELVYRAENLSRIVVIEERAWSVVNGLARDRSVVRVHDAMDEADQKPARNELGLPRGHGRQQGVIGAVRAQQLRIVPSNDMVGEPPHRVSVAASGKILEGAHADMAGGNAGQ